MVFPYNGSKVRGFLFSFLAWTLPIVVAGCQTIHPARTPAEMASEPVVDLVLGPGDVIDIRFFYTPELDESQIIRPDGKITMNLIGDVPAAGLTPAELHESLLQHYAGHLRDPRISIMVRRVNEARIWVGGEVRRPGPVEMNGRLSLLEAIMNVGGPVRPTADLHNVVVVRQKGGKHYGCVVDAGDALLGREGMQFLLQPRDIVFVPPTAVTRANDWVEQYINRMVPRPGIVVLYPIGPDNAGTAGVDLTTP